MGFYINYDSNGIVMTPWDKCTPLLLDGATEIPPPQEFAPNLVCVVDNGGIEAAAYAFDEREFKVFIAEKERKTRWFIYEHARALSGCNR